MKLFLAFMLLSLAVTGCGKRHTIEIADVTKPTILKLSPASNQSASVHSFYLHISGKIDGTAEIRATDVPTNRVSGNFEITRKGDFYAPGCVVEYIPKGVRTGWITVEYKFR